MKRIAMLLASALMVSGTASASDPAWLTDFRKADLNDSGGLSKSELDKSKSKQLQPIKDNLKAIDKDNDGHVTQAEYEQFLKLDQDNFAVQFRKADLNNSGGLSRKELEKVTAKDFDTLKKNFDVIDTDKDGQVTLDEYHAYQGATAKSADTTQAAVMKAKDQCQPDCGVVVDFDRYKIQGEGSAMGAVAGGVAGGVLGNQAVGGTVATVGGAAGGAYVGNQIEKRLKTKKMVKVTVKLDNGQQQDYKFEADKSPFARGERVQIKDGQLVKYTGQ